MANTELLEWMRLLVSNVSPSTRSVFYQGSFFFPTYLKIMDMA